MELQDYKVLLTGSEGKLGGRIKKELIATGVSGILYYDRKLGQDLLDHKKVRKACRECNAVVHAAGLPHPGMGSVTEYLWFNSIGSLVLLEEAIRSKHKVFVYISSGCVYGWDTGTPVPGPFPVSEDSPLVYDAAEPYTISKITTENMLKAHGHEGLIKIVILRLAPIWNETDAPKKEYLGAAVSPATAVNAVINSLVLDTDEKVSIYNIADPWRCGDYSIKRALRDGIIK